jgi:hypothetical protein
MRGGRYAVTPNAVNGLAPTSDCITTIDSIWVSARHAARFFPSRHAAFEAPGERVFARISVMDGERAYKSRLGKDWKRLVAVTANRKGAVSMTGRRMIPGGAGSLRDLRSSSCSSQSRRRRARRRSVYPFSYPFCGKLTIANR